jgi:tetratricopeptide (TPR) repeat protein
MMKSPIIWVAVLMLGCAALQAAAADHLLTRSQALAQVSSADVKQRRAAVDRLGQVGLMSDARVLAKSLHDRDEVTRELAEASIWRVWSHSGDAKVDALFERGVQEMNIGAFELAIETFTSVITNKPEFAEGWNKRATIYFLAGEFDKSMKDCDEVLKRNPLHFGALAGYGQIYVQLEQPERALDYFQRALKINPNMDGVARNIEALKEMISRRRGRMI